MHSLKHTLNTGSRAQNLTTWTRLTAATVLNTIANFIASQVASSHGFSFSLFISPLYVFAIVLWGVAYLLYLQVLECLALSVAYPLFIGFTLLAVSAQKALLDSGSFTTSSASY